MIRIEITQRDGRLWVATTDPITLMKSHCDYIYRASVDLYLDVIQEQATANGFDVDVKDHAK